VHLVRTIICVVKSTGVVCLRIMCLAVKYQALPVQHEGIFFHVYLKCAGYVVNPRGL
jgi:hypothetical protein